jgi:hypothetical protein
LADARTIILRALAMDDMAYSPDHPQVAAALANLGNVQQKLRNQ